MSNPTRVVATAAIALLTAALGGCTYDYLQRTDRVAFSSGNAVKANIAAQTIDPSKASMYSTKGLGKDGIVTGDATAEAPASE